MSKHWVRVLSVVGLLVLTTAIGCGVSAGTTPGGGGFVSFSILGKTFTFSFGDAGVVATRANEAVDQAAGLTLFERQPEQTPSSGRMQLRSSDIGVARLLNGKAVVGLQDAPLEGSATVRFSIAEGISAAACDSAALLAEYQLNVVAGAPSIAAEVYELSHEALAVIAANEVTVCIEVTADFDGVLTFSGFSLTFDGGEGGVDASFVLENTDVENIHILLPHEDFETSNRISPGGSSSVTLEGVEVGDTITVRAGRDGVVLDTVDCPTIAEAEYSATAVWNGVQLTCFAEQSGGEPATGDTGTVSGQVVNALTGDAVAGADVALAGTTLSTTTEAGGAFTIADVPVGGQDVVVTAVGFVDSSTTIVVLTAATATTQVGLVPLGEAGDLVTIVLTWGESPLDLDLHLSGPDGAGGRFHAFYQNQSPVGHAFLDLDDTVSFGPETMTIRPVSGVFVAGEYHVWVHNYSGGPEFDVSQAHVTVTVGGAQLAQYDVGAAAGSPVDDVWQVINLTVDADGNVTAVTQVQTLAPGFADDVF